MTAADDDTTEDRTIHLTRSRPVVEPDSGVSPALVMLSGYDAGRLYLLESAGMVVGRAEDCDIQVLEPTVSRKHARFAVTEQGVEVVDLRSSNGVTVNDRRVQRQWLEPQDVIHLGEAVSLRFAPMTEAEQRYQQRLFEDAVRDALTGLHNKRYFLGVLERRLFLARRRLGSLAVLMLDVDHFKGINDTHGHQIGDEALRHVADLIRQESRDKDLIGRYGGEEFIALLIDVDADGAVRIAERVRKAIAATPLTRAGLTVPLTISIGLASVGEVGGLLMGEPDDVLAERVIALADARLYAAKRQGRNRVVSGDT